MDWKAFTINNIKLCGIKAALTKSLLEILFLSSPCAVLLVFTLGKCLHSQTAVALLCLTGFLALLLRRCVIAVFSETQRLHSSSTQRGLWHFSRPRITGGFCYWLLRRINTGAEWNSVNVNSTLFTQSLPLHDLFSSTDWHTKSKCSQYTQHVVTCGRGCPVTKHCSSRVSPSLIVYTLSL